MNYKLIREELKQMGMLDEVMGLLRDCCLYIMDIKFSGEQHHFKDMYNFVFKNKFWIKEGIGEDMVEEMLMTLEIPPYHRLSKEWKVEKISKIMEQIKEIRELLKEEDTKIYH